MHYCEVLMHQCLERGWEYMSIAPAVKACCCLLYDHAGKHAQILGIKLALSSPCIEPVAACNMAQANKLKVLHLKSSALEFSCISACWWYAQWSYADVQACLTCWRLLGGSWSSTSLLRRRTITVLLRTLFSSARLLAPANNMPSWCNLLKIA